MATKKILKLFLRIYVVKMLLRVTMYKAPDGGWGVESPSSSNIN
jgi:hypothetical protein